MTHTNLFSLVTFLLISSISKCQMSEVDLRITADWNNLIFLPCFGEDEVVAWKIDSSLYYIGDLPLEVKYHQRGLTVYTKQTNNTESTYICFGYNEIEGTLIEQYSVALTVKETLKLETNLIQGDLSGPLHLSVTENNTIYIPCLGAEDPNDIHVWRIDGVTYASNLPQYHEHHRLFTGIIVNHLATMLRPDLTYECYNAHGNIIGTVIVKVISSRDMLPVNIIIDENRNFAVQSISRENVDSKMICIKQDNSASINFTFMEQNQMMILILYTDQNEQKCACPLFRSSENANISDCQCLDLEVGNNTIKFIHLTNGTRIAIAVDNYTTAINTRRTLTHLMLFLTGFVEAFPAPNIDLRRDMVCATSNIQPGTIIISVQDVTMDILIQEESENRTACISLDILPSSCEPILVSTKSRDICGKESGPNGLGSDIPSKGQECKCIQQKANFTLLTDQTSHPNEVTLGLRSTCKVDALANQTISKLFLLATCTNESVACFSQEQLEFETKCEGFVTFTIPHLLPATTYHFTLMKYDDTSEQCFIQHLGPIITDSIYDPAVAVITGSLSAVIMIISFLTILCCTLLIVRKKQHLRYNITRFEIQHNAENKKAKYL